MLDLNSRELKRKQLIFIMEKYKKGFTHKEIAVILNLKENTVKTKVNRTLSKMTEREQMDLREQHNLNKLERRDIKRALNYECNKEIGNRAFIKSNRSIYKTRENGNIVLKSEKELGCSISWDTPKNLVNDAREEKKEEFRPTISSEVGRVLVSHYSKDLSNTRVLSDGERRVIYNSNYLN
ncbi:sigma factor-like helix-turn-helix DNA-binding protein [Clostridium perfringens]|uniref:RNA polymerase sigma factor 70 region 4 type 2 domain-containing protein n=1 Tax=Clostridium perfringens TaxID=1502 RepID=A0A4Y5T369_CLOPF|nr:LuxR C-terminal-related transcriptional regulator [Clostridium perfringens]QDB00946.1 hypothetical protein [Clostridium perfringens]HAT4340671.1 sigma-70 family RNA polymerase sigma factor [Clostridium perfringens]HAT4346101.1 sigma-70 family RNA polymerase sigma factor [Clostridium perfringens]